MRVLILLLVVGFFCEAAIAEPFEGSATFACYEAALAATRESNVEEVCNRAVQETNLTRIELAASYTNRALILAQNGNLQAALADHNRALELESNNVNILVNRANTYFLTNEYALALADLDAGITLASPFRGEILAVAHYNRAIIHASIGNKEFARQDASRAVTLAPEKNSYRELLTQLTQSSQNKPEAR